MVNAALDIPRAAHALILAFPKMPPRIFISDEGSRVLIELDTLLRINELNAFTLVNMSLSTTLII